MRLALTLAAALFLSFLLSACAARHAAGKPGAAAAGPGYTACPHCGRTFTVTQE